MAINFAGYVYKDNGAAVSGADVYLKQVSDGVTEASTTTDSNGYWAFSESDEDRYYVEIASGSSKRFIRWADEISLKEIDVRNNEANTTPAATFTNLTNNASNQVAVFSGANTTRADSDEIYLSFKLANSAGDIEEFARITAEAVDVTDGEEDGQLRFGVAKNDGTITDVFTINSTTGGETSMTLDVSGDLVLDADGGDVFFKDGGTTFGSATNSSGNLILKSGTTTAATFSGANVTFAGTVDATTDFTIGDTVITDGVVTDSTGLQLAANLDINGTADISGDLTLSGGADGALQFTNAGENSIKIPDNQASALIIEEADNAYITFVTSNGSEAITVAKATTFSAGIANAGTIGAGTWQGTAIASSYIAADAITSAKIADDAVGADELAANAVVDASVASGAAIAVSKLALTAGDGLTLNTNDMDLDATLTTVTSITNASLVVGRDADNDIDFTTDNNIRFRAGGEDQLTLTDGALTPSSNAIVDLGTDALEFKDAYFDGTLEADTITIGGTNIVTGELITTLGTISAGTWQGTAIASAYLDSDTAHLSTTQTFTGAKTFTNTVTVGVDDDGKDVKFFGATPGAYTLWDESENEFILAGAARMGIGTTNTNMIFNIEDGAGGSDYVRLGGSTTTTGNMAYITRDKASGSTNSPVVRLRQNNSGDDQDTLLVEQDGTGNILTLKDGGTSIFSVADGGNVFIGDTENAGSTLGLTINQGIADDEAIALKSSDITHGYTSKTETDTYATFQKRNGENGGLRIEAFQDTDDAYDILTLTNYRRGQPHDLGTAAVTDYGSTDIYVECHNGNNSAVAVDDDKALFSVSRRNASGIHAAFIVNSTGELHSDAATGLTTDVFDKEDDVMLVRAFDLARDKESDKKTLIKSGWDKFAHKFEDRLVELGILGKKINEGGMLNLTRLLFLHNGAIFQEFEKRQALEDKVKTLEAKLQAIGG